MKTLEESIAAAIPLKHHVTECTPVPEHIANVNGWTHSFIAVGPRGGQAVFGWAKPGFAVVAVRR